MIKIICVGKKHDSIYADAIAHFEKRLGVYTKFAWTLLPHSSLEGNTARDEESIRIIQKLSQDDYVILLDETGELITSADLASHIERAQNSSRTITCIIGGAYGVSEELKNRADLKVAFGRVVFPHQLMRVLVLEQLYRSHSILAGSKYHHD
jgi:23S rRNA (pseudouridine1915-N3)-methyltransferase